MDTCTLNPAPVDATPTAPAPLYPMLPRPRGLGFDEAVALLDRAVEEKGPDYVYAKVKTSCYDHGHCVNFDQGKPSCLIGHLLSYLDYGPLHLEFSLAYGPRPVDITDGGVESVFGRIGLLTDPRTMRMLTLAQRLQDQGVPWGHVVASATHANAR